MTKATKDTGTKLRFFGVGKMLPFAKKYRKMMVTMLVLSLLGSLADTLVPIYQKYSLDHYIGGKTLDTMVLFVIVYIITVAMQSFVNYIACRNAMTVEVSMNRDLRQAAFNHLQTLSFSYFNQNSVGYIHERVLSDTSRIGSLFSWTIIEGCWQFSYLIGALIVMFIVNAKLAVLVAAVLPFAALLFSFFQRRLIKANREIREINSNITSSFNEGITGAKTIKTLSVEDSMESRFTNETDHMYRRTVGASRLNGGFAATISLASSIAMAVVMWRGGFIDESEVGTYSMFMNYAIGMMEPLRWLVNTISGLITTQVNIERFSNLLAVKSDVIDTPEVIEKYGDTFNGKRENWEPLNGDIEFEDVSFRYPDGDEMVLENFNMKIPFGSNIAIVGETGAGKSTLVNLVCRFYEPTKGRVLIDGKDARERSQMWLHSSIGYVLQNPQLFSGTLRDNLLYGNPDATEEQILEAVRLVSADEVVARLEKGLDTDVGEGGDLLSTGEKQLFSFARAILANPRIIVLDEATASVDTITESKIQAAIDKVISGRTSLVIAHRLSTVKNADCIIVVKNGKIIEKGTHSELLALRGYYHSLYTRQYEDEATAKILE